MSIPSPRISYGCYLPMRSLENGPVWLEVNHYRPEPDVHVGPGLARAVLLEWNLPADREPGLYLGEVVFRAGSVESRVPLRIRVHAVALPPVPIPVGLFLSALPFGSDTMDIERWWALQTELLDEQARAGLNCLTGGPGLLFRSRRSDGELVLRGGDALRYLELARARGISRAAVNYGSFFPSLRVDRVGASAFARAWQTLVDAHAIPPFYFSSYDEPGTPAETQAALEQVAPLTAAGLRTMGFLSHARDDGLGERLIAATYAPALAVHTPEDLRALKAQGRHPWVYNNGIDRYAMGLHLWRNLHAGAEGRLEWIGLITQGFAFNQLDGRESATAAWMVHDRLGLLPTPRWLSAREGLLDLRVRLALERAVPAGDPVLAAWSSQGYGQDRPRWSDAALEAERGAMLERLSRGP